MSTGWCRMIYCCFCFILRLDKIGVLLFLPFNFGHKNTTEWKILNLSQLMTIQGFQNTSKLLLQLKMLFYPVH